MDIANGKSWSEVIKELPSWYEQYVAANPDAQPLEMEIQARANRFGCLGKDSILEIVRWGGDPYGLSSRIRRANTESQVRQMTSEAIDVLDDPDAALGKVTRVRWLGDSFGSKVLAMLSPQTHAVWDQVVKNALRSAKNAPTSYGDFITLLHQVARRITAPNPRGLGSTWWVRDVEAGLFQFAWPADRGGNGGTVVGMLPSREVRYGRV